MSNSDLIGPAVSTFTDSQWATFLETRGRNRLITPGRATRGKTLAALSKAWNISPEAILKAFETLSKGETT